MLASRSAWTLTAIVLAAAGHASAGTCTAIPSPVWENEMDFPGDPFAANGGGPQDPGFVKLTIMTCDPSAVYYQDSNLYPFHYEFATQWLDPFVGLTVEEFGAVTLYNAGREALLGAVVLPPAPAGELPIQEYGVQLISLDPLDPQIVVDAFLAVTGSVDAAPGVQPFYFPTFEQLESAQQNATFFAAHGIQISSPARWLDGNACYSKGWALGRLKFFPADAVAEAFLAGDLTSDDILLTDNVPSNLPLVAGVLSLAPATPNSHVVILANTFQVPFAFLGDPGDAERAQELVGRRIVLRSFDKFELFFGDDVCDLRLIDVEDELTPQQIDEILLLKVPPPLDIQPVTPLGQYARSTHLLTPGHIKYFGGKASNFGFLRRSIPDSSPTALGISFDLWTGFLDQTLPGGQTLRESIDATLAQYGFPPADMAAFSQEMLAIRDLIKDDAVTHFTGQEQDAILTVLQQALWSFDPLKKIRFRSSTNMEDTEQFTGAGLYDSFSGCLADELDGDDTGPSLCDADQTEERGVFRAIRRVFASFYNDSAVLERLRHGVSETEVGMALLVHHSFPDPIELANGVATFERGPFMNDTIGLVTQLGASPVTNPEPGAIPEEVKVSIFSPSTIVPTLVASSNLVILGETVMDWTQDYVDLAELLLEAADRFELETGKTEFLLDFEYKKVDPGGGALPAGGLVVKQIRQIPQPDTTPTITPFLVNEPTGLVPYGSPPGRVKTRLLLETRSTWLDEPSLSESIYAEVTMDFTDGCRVLQLEGSVPALPGASHAYDTSNEQSRDSWVLDDLPNPRDYTLETGGLGTLVSAAQSPILTLRDLAELGLPLRVEHQDPVPTVPGYPDTITSETVTLIPALDPDDEDDVCRLLEPPGGVVIDTCYKLHPPPMVCAGCAPILSRFGASTITGLTTSPIVLDGQYSQTYVAGAHAFFESFAFEPLLEEGVSLATLEELQAQNIRLIRVEISNVGEPVLELMLFDDAAVGQSCAAPVATGALPAGAPLGVAKAPGGDLVLDWIPSCVASDDDYAVYEGVLGEFTSHTARECTTGGESAATLTPASYDAYYLVVPRNAHFEGSYGVDGAGNERPQAAAPCFARESKGCD